MDETFPDVGSMSDAELVNRLKSKRGGGDATITGADVEGLTEILLGKIPKPPADSAT